MNALTRFAIAALLLAGPAVLLGCDSTDDDEVTATGTVTNIFDYPVQEATLSFSSSSAARADGGAARAGTFTATTNEEGDFSITLPEGDYTVTVAAAGYAEQEFSTSVRGGALGVPALSGEGNVDVELNNALTGPIREGAVECGRHLPGGGVSATEMDATTTPQGRLVVEGTFTGAAACSVLDGDVSIPFDFTITENTTGSVTATPPPPGGALRIVLTWGEQPRDLDSHLTGPDGQGGRFHIRWNNRSFGQSNLDRDDTSSFGPETITLVPEATGTYRYSVHNWTQQNSPQGGEGIYESPAIVTVFDEEGRSCAYKAPEPTAANDGLDANTWRVFETEATLEDGEIAIAAPCTPGQEGLPGLGYFKASSHNDATVFRPEGPKQPLPADLRF